MEVGQGSDWGCSAKRKRNSGNSYEMTRVDSTSMGPQENTTKHCARILQSYDLKLPCNAHCASWSMWNRRTEAEGSGTLASVLSDWRFFNMSLRRIESVVLPSAYYIIKSYLNIGVHEMCQVACISRSDFLAFSGNKNWHVYENVNNPVPFYFISDLGQQLVTSFLIAC
jgi:hypothetical protein